MAKEIYEDLEGDLKVISKVLFDRVRHKGLESFLEKADLVMITPSHEQYRKAGHKVTGGVFVGEGEHIEDMDLYMIEAKTSKMIEVRLSDYIEKNGGKGFSLNGFVVENVGYYKSFKDDEMMRHLMKLVGLNSFESFTPDSFGIVVEAFRKISGYPSLFVHASIHDKKEGSFEVTYMIKKEGEPLPKEFSNTLKERVEKKAKA